jgi:prolipoprotein diacylglyceryltransferase
MFILYATTRFFIEFLRDDNPFEFAWWLTISQIVTVLMLVFGAVFMAVFQRMAPDKISVGGPK